MNSLQAMRHSIFLAASLVSAFCARVHAASDTSLESFIRTPSIESWDHFETDVRRGRYGSNGIIYQKLVEFHEARSRRDLPNSMALKGITPNEHVALERKRADAALNYIRKNNTTDFWRIIDKMGIQDFDDNLMRTACELAARVSPPKFEKIATEVNKHYPGESWIVEILRERWLPKKTRQGPN